MSGEGTSWGFLSGRAVRLFEWGLLLVFVVGFTGWVALRGPVVDYAYYRMGVEGLKTGAPVFEWPRDDFLATLHEISVPREAFGPPGEPLSELMRPYPYPPLTAMLMLPLSGMEYRSGMAIWLALMALSWVGAVLVLASQIPDPGSRRLFRFAGWTFLPALISIYAGQVNPLAVLAGSAGLSYAAKESRIRAGLGLAVSLSLKPILLALVAWSAWTFRFRTLLAIVLGFLGLLAAGAVVFGPEVLNFTGAMKPRIETYLPAQNLFGVLGRLIPSLPESVGVTHPGIWVALVMGAGTAWALGLPGKRPSTGLVEAGLMIAALLIVNPRTWFHHYMVLLIPIAALFVRFPDRGVVWRAVLMVALAALALFGVGWHQLEGIPVLREVGWIGGVVLWLLLLVETRRESVRHVPVAAGT